MDGDSTMGSLFQCLTITEEIFPNIQPPLAQGHSLSSYCLLSGQSSEMLQVEEILGLTVLATPWETAFTASLDLWINENNKKSPRLEWV